MGIMFLFSGIAVSQINDLHSLIHNAGGRFNYPVLNLGRTYPNSDGTWRIQGQIIFDRVDYYNSSYYQQNNFSQAAYINQLREIELRRYQNHMNQKIYMENIRRMYPVYPLHLDMNRVEYYPTNNYYYRPQPIKTKRFYRRY